VSGGELAYPRRQRLELREIKFNVKVQRKDFFVILFLRRTHNENKKHHIKRSKSLFVYVVPHEATFSTQHAKMGHPSSELDHSLVKNHKSIISRKHGKQRQKPPIEGKKG
jgi:hypothetical protein